MYHSDTGDGFGRFVIPAHLGKGRHLHIIAADGEETGWEHVSVSLPQRPERTPTWDEMCFVKSLFWDDEAAVMQLHPPASQYVNRHAGCLHLWRPTREPIPLPDKIMV